MSYAKDTKVPVDRSKSEIERLLCKYGADQFAYASSIDAALIGFRVHQRMIRFHLPNPNPDKFRSEDSYAQEARRRWRALCLVIKAKLEAVQSGITTFEQEFYAHILLPGGMTVYESSRIGVDQAYKTGKPPDMLLGFSGEKK